MRKVRIVSFWWPQVCWIVSLYLAAVYIACSEVWEPLNVHWVESRLLLPVQ
jgi:hypothetical protein